MGTRGGWKGWIYLLVDCDKLLGLMTRGGDGYHCGNGIYNVGGQLISEVGESSELNDYLEILWGAE